MSDDEKVTLDRLRNEFHEAVKQFVDKTTKAIESAETQSNDYLDKLVEAKSKIEELEKASADQEAELDKLRVIKNQIIDFDAVERLVNFAPGDPGHLCPMHERVEKVLARANTDRNNVIVELSELRAEIIPELERLEGHEKRLQIIVDEFIGKVKDKRLAALLREAKDAFINNNQAQ